MKYMYSLAQTVRRKWSKLVEYVERTEEKRMYEKEVHELRCHSGGMKVNGGIFSQSSHHPYSLITKEPETDPISADCRAKLLFTTTVVFPQYYEHTYIV